jgi:hypothetical protein
MVHNQVRYRPEGVTPSLGGTLPRTAMVGGRRRLILAGTAGNVMEWYDFAICGYFAATIGRHFSPPRTPRPRPRRRHGAGFLHRSPGPSGAPRT